MPKPGMGETYKYVDEKGSVHFVDSFEKIPEKYRKDMQVIREHRTGDRI